ncbi:MAG: hypothetical protein NTZ29_02430 [Verrucomicrobia bacterium]|nr:hypothetical protein [Verrucomicrobiota bacterium]
MARTSALTAGCPDNARETVEVETPHASAKELRETFAIVMQRLHYSAPDTSENLFHSLFV